MMHASFRVCFINDFGKWLRPCYRNFGLLTEVCNYSIKLENCVWKRTFRTCRPISALKTDYYDLLGVSASASAEQIKAAYLEMAKKHHPDANLGDDGSAARMFQAAAEAFEVLGSEEKRRRYDAFGMDGKGRQKKKKRKNNIQRDEEFANEEASKEFYDRVYSRFSGQFADAGLGVDPSQHRDFVSNEFGEGPTLQAFFKLSFDESVTGVSKRTSLNVVDQCLMCMGYGSKFRGGKRSCAACNGSGRETYTEGAMAVRVVCRTCKGRGYTIRAECYECDGKGKVLQRKIYSIPIPAGVEDGQTMKVRIGENDVLFHLSVGDSDRFSRHGADVSADVVVPLTCAALGGKVLVRGLLDEKFEVDVPAGTCSHDVIRIGGRGIRRLDHHDCGDLLLNVVLKSLVVASGRQRELMERFAELETEIDGTVKVEESSG